MALKPDFEAIKRLPSDVMLTPVETARLLGYTKAGLMNRIKRSRIKAVRVAGRWYILGQDIKDEVVFNYEQEPLEENIVED